MRIPAIGLSLLVLLAGSHGVKGEDLIPMGNTLGFDAVGPPLVGAPTLEMHNSMFGRSVVLSKNDGGKRVLIGSPMHGFKTPEAEESQVNHEGGGVFLYELDDKKEATWKLVWFLPGQTHEKLGSSLDLSADGTRVAIRRRRGRWDYVEIYDIHGTTHQATRVGDALGCRGGGSGLTLSPSGSRVALSCEGFDNRRGRVEVFEQYKTFWKHLGSLEGSDPGMEYGHITAFSNNGNRLAIAAPGFSFNIQRRKCGLVQVFQYNGNSWVQRGNNVTGEEKFEYLGSSLDLSGDGRTVVTGSPGRNANGKNKVGAVKAFFDFRGVWLQSGKDMTGTDAGDEFGQAVSVSDTGVRIVATSPTHNQGRGQVRLFILKMGAWELHGEDITGHESGTRLGYSRSGVSLNGPGNRLAYASPFCGLSGCVRVADYVKIADKTIAPTAKPTEAPTIKTSAPTIEPTESPHVGSVSDEPTDEEPFQGIVFEGASATFNDDHPALLQIRYEFTPAVVRVHVYGRDCKWRLDKEYIKQKKRIESIAPDMNAMVLDLNINLEQLKDEFYSEEEDGTGIITICVRIDLVDENWKFLAFDQHIFSVELDTTAKFEVRGLQVTDGSPEVEVKASVDYTLSTCQCDESYSCISKSITAADEEVLICIGTLPGVRVASVQDLQLFRGSFTQTPVIDGIADENTVVEFYQGGAAIRTHISATLLESESSLDINGRGHCILSLVQDGARALLEDDAKEETFSFALAVEPSTVVETSSGGNTFIGSAATILAMTLFWLVA